HRRPLNHPNTGKRILRGALLIEYQEDGFAPTVRFSTSHTVLPGRPSPQRVTLRLVNSYSIGPWVPAETFRRSQQHSCKLLPTVSTAIGSLAMVATTGFVRLSPL